MPHGLNSLNPAHFLVPHSPGRHPRAAVAWARPVSRSLCRVGRTATPHPTTARVTHWIVGPVCQLFPPASRNEVRCPRMEVARSTRPLRISWGGMTCADLGYKASPPVSLDSLNQAIPERRKPSHHRRERNRGERN